MDERLEVNRLRWDERAPAHAASPDYGFERFAADPGHLSDIVRYDLPRLGPVAGLDAVHLQCHIGTDTVSLARLGARTEGLDFSGPALAEARRLAGLAGVDVTFHQADVYDAVEVLGPRRFDLVYTGIGVLGWLPDIRGWARVVAGLLRPGGRLFIREGHPMLWSMAIGRDELVIGYPYFETPDPVTDETGGTYVETDVEFSHNLAHEWNHGLGEIVQALLDAGMRLTALEEHRTVPWDALPGAMVRDGDTEWRLREHPEWLPLTYTLQAVREA